jgi:hypothetical protein
MRRHAGTALLSAVRSPARCLSGHEGSALLSAVRSLQHARCCCDCCSQAHVEALVEMYTADKEEALLGGQPDFVLDAIDNIDTKVGRRQA